MRKPAEMTFEQAASLPHAAMLALQGLTRFGRIREGDQVLINGGGGGVGAIALQIAKHHGAEVTGVDAIAKLATMKALGFDQVVDYTRDDFTRMGRTYDLILDTRTKRSPWRFLPALKDGGRYVTVGGDLRRLLEVFALGPILSKLSGKDVRILALRPSAGLDEINRLFQAGKLKCLIDGPYPLKDVPRAIQRFGDAQQPGQDRDSRGVVPRVRARQVRQRPVSRSRGVTGPVRRSRAARKMQTPGGRADHALAPLSGLPPNDSADAQA